MQRPGPILLVWLVAVLAAWTDPLHAASRKALSPACQQVDYEDAQRLFACVGTLSSMIYQEMHKRACADLARSVRHDLGQTKAALPSCRVLAEVSVMMTGQAPAWGDCLDYPGDEPQAHLRRCLAGFAPAYYGERGYKQRLETCEGALASYEQALKASQAEWSNRLPEHYRRPSCDLVHPVIAELIGREAMYLQCAQYDPADVRGHLLRCLTSRDDQYLNLADCPAVRRAYEARLRATHGGLPPSYRVLSCGEAQAVLDKAVAEREASKRQKASLVAQKEQAEHERQGAEQKRLEQLREEICARQAKREKTTEACDPGPNRYPERAQGEILTALQSGCVSAIPAKALLFIGGLAEPLVGQCRLPPNSAERLELARFIQTAQLAAAGGSQYSNPDLGRMVEDQAQSQQAYLLGLGTFEDLGGCRSPMASGILGYLRALRANSLWIDGCEVHYAGRYTREQCACVADHLMMLFPDIHARPFSRGAISWLTEAQPFVALQLGVSCRIGNY